MTQNRSYPERIGNYKILRTLGEGGMGIVFEAEQLQPRRLVALKVVRGGPFADEQKLRFFQREVQTLARLRHPAIAAIYDAGCTETGQNYFAMELVRGKGLVEYLREAGDEAPKTQEELRRRMAIFVSICQAIHYAHQRGVIHRDLKPSNILVTSESSLARPDSPGQTMPQIKILDFGLARIAETELGASSAFSRPGQVLGTLSYMSPEQARANPDEIDVRTDIYSLGVILYEMLTGCLPLDFTGAAWPDALRKLGEDSPRKPRQMNPALDADQETILLKAIEKEPARRYASAASFAEDVERYLRNEPIQARHQSTVYQLRKLVTRHRKAFTAAAAFFLLICGFAVTMAVLSSQIAAERDQAELARREGDVQRRAAERSLETAQRVTGFLTGLFRVSDPGESQGRTIDAREFLDRGAAEIAAGLREEPLVRAALLAAMGEVYLNLSETEKARPLLEEALALRRTALPAGSAEIAEGCNTLASLLRAASELERAAVVAKEAVESARRRGRGAEIALAQYLGTLAKIRFDSGDAKEALTLLEEAIRVEESSAAPNPWLERDLVGTLAVALRALGRTAEAEPHYRRCLALARQVRGDDHPDTLSAMDNLALFLAQNGKEKEAEPLYRDALLRLRRIFPEGHPTLAVCLNNLGSLLEGMEKAAEAEPLYRESLQIMRKIQGPGHPKTLAVSNNLGRLLYEQGDLEGAAKAFREALEGARRRLPADHPDTALYQYNLGSVLEDRRELADAAALYRESLAIRRKRLPKDHPDILWTLYALGRTAHDLGEWKESSASLQEAEGFLRKREPHDEMLLSGVLASLGSTLVKSGASSEAEPKLREAIEIRVGRLPKGHWLLANPRSILGECLAALGRAKEAEELLLQSYEELVKAKGENDLLSRRALDRIIRFYESGREPEKAAPWKSRANSSAGPQ